MTEYGFVIHKGTRIVSDRLVSTVVNLVVKDDGPLRSALKVIWDEIPLGFEDQEDLERVLEEEPETLFDALDPYSGEHFVEKIYRNGKLIYSYDD